MNTDPQRRKKRRCVVGYIEKEEFTSLKGFEKLMFKVKLPPFPTDLTHSPATVGTRTVQYKVNTSMMCTGIYTVPIL